MRKFGPEHFAEASRQAVVDMVADIKRLYSTDKNE